MVLHPDIQQKARSEIDRVIGTDHLPRLEDQDKLVYFTAVLKECLRWAPVAPVGLAHRIVQEDDYKGYRIPKGCTIISNIWFEFSSGVQYLMNDMLCY